MKKRKKSIDAKVWAVRIISIVIALLLVLSVFAMLFYM